MTIYTSNMNANIAFHALITTHNIAHVRITNTRLGRSREIPVAGLDRIAGTDIPEYTPDILSEIEIDEVTLTMRAGIVTLVRWRKARVSVLGRCRRYLSAKARYIYGPARAVKELSNETTRFGLVD